MNYAVLGATKGIGRAVARILAERGDAVCVLGRDSGEVGRSAADLRARGARGEISELECDLENTAAFEHVVAALWEKLPRVDAVIITAAAFGTQDELENDSFRAHKLLTVNFANTVYLCELLRKRLLAQGGGTLCVVSSVAGDRGRKPVGIYGSSKAGLSHYLESLDHKYRASGLVTVCIKPGFVKTGMTAGLKPPPFAGEPDRVAADIVHAVDAKLPLIYTPGIWRLVMLAIRHLPRFVMRRVGF